MASGCFLPITKPWAQMNLPPCLLGKHPLPAGLAERGEGWWPAAEHLLPDILQGAGWGSHARSLLWAAQGPWG